MSPRSLLYFWVVLSYSNLSVRLVEHCVDRAGCVDRRVRTSTLVALVGRHFVSAANTETVAPFLWFATSNASRANRI